MAEPALKFPETNERIAPPASASLKDRGRRRLRVILLMVVTGVGPFVIMVSFLFLLQHVLFNNLMERYHGQQ